MGAERGAVASDGSGGSSAARLEGVDGVLFALMLCAFCLVGVVGDGESDSSLFVVVWLGIFIF